VGQDGATLAKPKVRAGDEDLEVLESVLLPESDGTYRLRFPAPPGDGLVPVSLSIGGQASPPALLPVGSGAAMRKSLGMRRASPDSLVDMVSCAGGFIPEVTGNLAGDAKTPPETLGGTRLTVKDAAGEERPARIVRVSWSGVTFIVPPGTASGLAVVTVTSRDGYVSQGYLDVRAVEPAEPGFSPYFSGYAVRVRNGVPTVEPAFQLCRNGWWCFSVDMGPESDEVYLIVLTTGLRNRTSVGNVRILIGDQPATVDYAGAQGEYAGWDQMNIRLPRSLAGRGLLTMQMAVDGIPDNAFYSDTFLYAEFR
jgi:uncharacterized protein (TIGR03437 family)